VLPPSGLRSFVADGLPQVSKCPRAAEKLAGSALACRSVRVATPEGSPLCLGRYEQPARNDSAFMCGEGLAGAMVVAGDVGALLTTAAP